MASLAIEPTLVTELPSDTAELELLPRQYKWEYLPRAGSDTLLVVFSPRPSFVLRSYDFGYARVDLVDLGSAYFTGQSGGACQRLAAFVRQHGFSRVLFLGSSKGAFGALLWAAHSGRFMKGVDVRCLAFSPQTQLYPFNERLYFPSYKRLMSKIDEPTTTARGLKTYGDVKDLIEKQRNVRFTIVYGETDPVDAPEAARVFGPHIRKYPVPVPFHGSVTAFTLDRGNPGKINALVRKLYSDAKTDADLASCLPESPRELARSFSGMHWVPSLQHIVAETMAS